LSSTPLLYLKINIKMIWWQIPEDDLFSVKFLSGYGLQFHSMIKRWSKEWNLPLFRRTRTVGKAIMYKLNLGSKQGCGTEIMPR